MKPSRLAVAARGNPSLGRQIDHMGLSQMGLWDRLNPRRGGSLTFQIFNALCVFSSVVRICRREGKR